MRKRTPSACRLLLPACLLLLTTAVVSADPALPPAPEKPVFTPVVSWSGGEEDALTLVQVRWGRHKDFERVVFEFSGGKGGGLPVLEAHSEGYPERLVLTLAGVVEWKPEAVLSFATLRKSRLLSALNSYDPCGPGLVLSLLPARPVLYSLSALGNPSRLVVDLSPNPVPPSPDLRYFLQTPPLEGDLACLFLQAVKEETGKPGRLLTTVSGQVVGEAGLYETKEAAREALGRLSGLTERFSLDLRTRGPLDVPPDSY